MCNHASATINVEAQPGYVILGATCQGCGAPFTFDDRCLPRPPRMTSGLSTSSIQPLVILSPNRIQAEVPIKPGPPSGQRECSHIYLRVVRAEHIGCAAVVRLACGQCDAPFVFHGLRGSHGSKENWGTTTDHNQELHAPLVPPA